MKKQILLPYTTFGALLMLALLVLLALVPFSVIFWAVGLAAPWWVALPCGLAGSLLAVLCSVKFKD
jgi:hypothetical protein